MQTAMNPMTAALMQRAGGQGAAMAPAMPQSGMPGGAPGAGVKVNPMVVALMRALMQGQAGRGAGMPQQGPGPVVPGGAMPQRPAMPMPGAGGAAAGMPPQGGQMNPMVAALMAKAAGRA